MRQKGKASLDAASTRQHLGKKSSKGKRGKRHVLRAEGVAIFRLGEGKKSGGERNEI